MKDVTYQLQNESIVTMPMVPTQSLCLESLSIVRDYFDGRRINIGIVYRASSPLGSGKDSQALSKSTSTAISADEELNETELLSVEEPPSPAIPPQFRQLLSDDHRIFIRKSQFCRIKIL